MWRKARYPLAVFLLLFVVLTGATLRQVYQAQLNWELLVGIDGCVHAVHYLEVGHTVLTQGTGFVHNHWFTGIDHDYYLSRAQVALSAGADPNSWAYVDGLGRIERPSWRDGLPFSLWPFRWRKQGHLIRMSALSMAVDDRDPTLVKALLDRGADVHQKGCDPDTQTLLAAAIPLGDEDMVKLLLDHGADINERQNGPSGGGPIWYSVNHATLSTTTATPLMIAVLCRPNLVDLLIKRGADVNLRTKEGKTALDFALEDGSPKPSDKDMFQIIQMLKAAGAKE